MKYVAYLNENGSEYTGVINSTADTIEQVNDTTLKINNAIVEFDEHIEFETVSNE